MKFSFNCLPISRILLHLNWLQSEPAFYGVQVPCELNSCNCGRPKCSRTWSAVFRQNFFSAVENAAYRMSVHLENCFKINICSEKQRCTRIFECPQELGVEIDYLGKRIDVDLGEYDVDYTLCGVYPYDPECPLPPRNCIDDYYGRIFIPVEDLPLIDEEVIPLEQLCFSYCDAKCVKDYQFLQQPCPLKYIYDEGGELLGVEARWKKWLLANPCACNLNIKSNDGFLDKVCVSYWYIDESQALDIYPTCKCDLCSCEGDRTSEDFEVKIANPKTGEVCVTPLYGCGKMPTIYLNYGIVIPDLPPSVEKAIALLALTELGQTHSCFKCDGFSTYQWLERSKDAGNAFDKLDSYLFDGTNAGMYAHRVIREVCKSPDKVEGPKGVYAGIL